MTVVVVLLYRPVTHDSYDLHAKSDPVLALPIATTSHLHLGLVVRLGFQKGENI